MEELSNKVERLSAEGYWFTPEEDYRFILNTEKKMGLREGIKEGREEKAKEVALNMLKKKIERSIIAECTGLSENEIEHLANKANLTEE